MSNTEKVTNIFVRKEAEKQRELESFFKSLEFEKMVKIIKENVSRKETGCGDDKVYGLFSQDFDHVCSAVYHVLGNNAKEVPSKFVDYVIDYRGIRFGLLIGQGAVYWAEKAD